MSAMEKNVDSPANVSTADDSSDHDSELLSVNESGLIRKLDIKILPAVTVLYLISFLDRSNGYVLFEIPCNIVLKQTTPKFWLPTLTVAFGIVATLLGVVQNLAGFFVARFVLGAVESGCVVFYLSMWYLRKERQFRICLFFSAAAIAGAFGGILAYGIANMNGVGGYKGWRWIFIIEGLATILIGILAYFFITNYPATAKSLNEAERKFIHKRLAADSDATEDEGFTWANVRAAVADPKCWLYGFGFHFMSLPLYTLSLFLPTIIKALGYSAASAQLLSIPPYAVAALLTIGISWVSERHGRRAPYLIFFALVAVIGYILLLSNSNPTKRPGISYLGTFFAAAGIYPTVGLVLSWPAINIGGQTKRAVANAMQISVGNIGAVIGTQLYRTEDSPRFVVGHSVALAYCVVSALLSAFTWWYLSRENIARDFRNSRDAKNSQDADQGIVGGAGGLKGDTDPRWRFMT